MLTFRERMRLKNHRFLHNRTEHLMNDVLTTDWEYRVNLPLWNKEPKRHELERITQLFMVNLNRTLFTRKELRSGLQVLCFPVLEKEYTNPHFHILLKVPKGTKIIKQPDKYYFVRSKVMKIITQLSLVKLRLVDPNGTKTFQKLYDSIGAVGYNLKEGIERIDYTNIRLTTAS